MKFVVYRTFSIYVEADNEEDALDAVSEVDMMDWGFVGDDVFLDMCSPAKDKT